MRSGTNRVAQAAWDSASMQIDDHAEELRRRIEVMAVCA